VTRAIAVIVTSVSIAALFAQPRGREWPSVTRETKPWTRWWWQGSAVDPASLTVSLQSIAGAGIGGVEITPIYGVRGAEARFIPYLSEPWMQMLAHALSAAQRLDVGVDMATGTGWPFGGPSVGDDTAARDMVHRRWTVAAGGRIDEPIRLVQTPLVRTARPLPQGPLTISDVASPVSATKDLQAIALEHVKYERALPLVAIVAYDGEGHATDLTSRVGSDGMLDWTAPRASSVYGVFGGWHGKLVERAAPGGEGFVIDHFSTDAIRGYLGGFDRALAARPLAGLRAFFNDSYEVDDAPGQADWTPRLFDEFQRRRGYDLREHLPELLSNVTRVAGIDAERVLADYRETVSDLLLETFTAEWGAWARRHGAVIRNQAHGSPANILDLYAASEIPETEGTDLPRYKWASSAGHVAGRRLISAEAATWLDDHFRATLAQVKAAVDHLFLGGVNHIVYHGSAYSPPDDQWPGWQFYAAVEFNPRNAWWDDVAALNAYVTRAQAWLQAGHADSDVLLYFPFHDAVAARGRGLLAHFGEANQRTAAEGFEAAASLLQSRGFTYDYVSDRQLQAVRADGGRLVTAAGASYSALVIPPTRFMPLEALEHAIALARQGTRVIVWKSWPADVPGLADLSSRRARLQQLVAANPPVTRDDDLEAALARAGVGREPLVDRGLMFARRADAGGRIYFVVNRSDRPVEGWIPFRLNATAATLFDAMHGRRGAAEIRPGADGVVEVHLDLAPGESLIVTAGPPADGRRFSFYAPAGPPVAIAGPWTLRFVKGGPSLPDARTIDALGSWTAFDGHAVKSFAGTARYTVTFPRPAGTATAWQIDLGAVRESARVRLNGRDVAVLIGSPYRFAVEAAALASTNTLEVSVTNLSANRIADLDRRGVPWKKFYNVNMPSKLPENRGPDGLFTAAKWDPLPSGLLGPVTLTPVTAR
jgi:alpha-L-rhamnosidase